MRNHRRIHKPIDERLRDCEAHLHLLLDALRQYPGEPHRFKQIAAELRVLVCESRTNRPLLLNLMDEHGFSYEVQPPGSPFEKQPIPLVGWKDDPQHQQLSEEIASAIEAGDEAALSRTLDRQAALRRPLPLREYVNRA